MELVQEFVVPRPVDTAWEVLTDVERIAPCMPGAQLTEVEGETYRGIVKVKVGPVLANFSGQAQFRELDRESHRAVLEARGKEARGQGLASAVVTAQLHDEGERTRVNVVTELTITGRLAQFGRGAMAEISSKLLGQFVECLESTVLREEAPAEAASAAEQPIAPAPPGPEPAEAAPETTVAATTAPPLAPAAPAATEQPAAGVRRIEAPEAKPVDLLRTAGGPILKRAVPALLVAAAIVAVIVIVVNN